MTRSLADLRPVGKLCSRARVIGGVNQLRQRRDHRPCASAGETGPGVVWRACDAIVQATAQNGTGDLPIKIHAHIARATGEPDWRP